MDFNRALVRTIRRMRASEVGTNETNNEDQTQNDTQHNTSRALNVVEIPAICSFKYCEHCKMVQPPRTFHCEIC